MTAVAVQEKPTSPLAIVRRDLDRMSSQFEAALPKHIPLERFKRVVMTAIQQSPQLLDCDPRSLWNAAMRAAQDGLLPDGRDGALVPFKGKVQWLPMIGGLRKKVRNSGELSTWEVHVVREKDHFEFELGDEPFIKHKPFFGDDPGKVIAAYSVATLKDGEKSREVMSVAEIERIRDMAPAGKSKDSPWNNHFEEMCRKTVARRHSKVLPMSTDLDDLLRGDDEIMDVKQEIRDRQQAERTSGTNVLDVFANSSMDREAAASPEALVGRDMPGEAGSPAEERVTQPETSGPVRQDESLMPEFGPADAFEVGREARKKGTQRKATPPEWRDGTPENETLIAAWLAGWDAEDEERKAKIHA